MKKILLILALASICFSCSKDDEDVTPKLDERLVNTKWETYDLAYSIIYGGTAYEVYEFISSTEVEQYTSKNGKIVDTDGTYSYTLEYPNLTITKEDNKKADFIFKDTRTFIRVGAEENDYYAKYIKQ
ncbi:hypothetical protein EV201_0638 [Ancylomarina subtilis]|uniref:Lipocalin-like protein n=1 Tax=Ancylomarina subtilis TaxID=1639035 RepID=A0A4Q7VIQ5_9BACT|nr:hypothetical protein [Ancylomarina subtilis]RZT96009.1 hypothetical protein EV201_0638 [Ancylomarina subtilis]